MAGAVVAHPRCTHDRHSTTPGDPLDDSAEDKVPLANVDLPALERCIDEELVDGSTRVFECADCLDSPEVEVRTSADAGIHLIRSMRPHRAATSHLTSDQRHLNKLSWPDALPGALPV
ncbi:MAG: hypothetical protein ACJ74O_05325 [Frankiaceae bacterium]